MKLSRLLGERYKEKPSEANMISHVYLLKGGYIRQVTSGIYSLLPPAKRIIDKIENIIREEMDKVDGQEVLFPVVLPAELWEESGRFSSVGGELARLKDRNGHDLVLGMTHEEAALHMARTEALTHTKYPFMIYQFQTKFRDEPRSRGGLIRTREFTMKDAYSFHTSYEDLTQYYDKCLEAYNTIFRRAGLPEVISVQADSGMMGGEISHEFMLICDDGEDYIAVCKSCGYSANIEVASSKTITDAQEQEQTEDVFTGDVITIDGLVKFFDLPLNRFAKAVVLSYKGSSKPLIVFLRGDYELSESKISKVVKAEVYPFTDYESVKESGINFGYIGPIGLDTSQVDIIFDKSLENETNLVCGANKEGYHTKGLNIIRDLTDTKFIDVSKAHSGAGCPKCQNGKIEIARGIEVGNIFQLGTKYTSSMNMKYTDESGNAAMPIMGCYGIGLGRLMASVIESRHDGYGPIWPISIAPWQVHICVLDRKKANVAELSDKLYTQISSRYETIIDDREVSAGMQFADADLLGVPIRVIISPKNLANNKIEIVTRDKSIKKFVDIDNCLNEIDGLVNELWSAYNTETSSEVLVTN